MEMREQLLAAAVRVVNEVGWRGATTRRIADAAGVNEVTLFRHFGSKDALIRAAMCWNAERATIPRLPDDPDVPEIELTAWVQEIFDHLFEARAHLRTTIGEIEAHPDLAVWARQVPKHLGSGLEAYLSRLRQRGLTAADFDSRAASSLLMGAVFADALTRDFASERLPAREEAPRLYVELLLRAIGYERKTA